MVAQTQPCSLAVAIETKQASQQTALDEHHLTLYGNGREGLKLRVDRIEQLLINAEKAKKYGWLRITGSLASVGTLVATCFTLLRILEFLGAMKP